MSLISKIVLAASVIIMITAPIWEGAFNIPLFNSFAVALMGMIVSVLIYYSDKWLNQDKQKLKNRRRKTK